MYDEQPFDTQYDETEPVTMLEAIRERRRQREAYRADYGDDGEPQREWWLPLLLKQFLAVAVLIGFVFAAKSVASEPFAELRAEYTRLMSENMGWAEIFAQIGNAVHSVFAAEVAEKPQENGSMEASGSTQPSENGTSPANGSTAEGTDNSDAMTVPMGGATLAEPDNLSFAPLWITAKAVRPVEGRVTSEFGLRVNPVTGVLGWHGGMDIAADEGTEILAAYAGTVHIVSADVISGNYVILNHGGRFQTFYCHASKILVKPDQNVDAGQAIALVGQTGQATGPHLHIELRLAGLCYDPAYAL